MSEKTQKSISYEGDGKNLFDAFYELVDDSKNQAQAILDLTTWNEVKSILSVGGGEGDIEKLVLENAPDSAMWVIEPSAEQCQAFNDKMVKQGYANRITDIFQIPFQSYNDSMKFDRIISVFSWFYIGDDPKYLNKLLNLLTDNGEALLILPNAKTAEADFSGDSKIPEFGIRLVESFKKLSCLVDVHTYTKWLPKEKLFDGDKLTFSAQAFVSFISSHGRQELSTEEWKEAYNKLYRRAKEQGVPLLWDVIKIRRA